MSTAMRALKLAQSKTIRAIFVFFQMQFFSNIACNSFRAKIWGPWRYMEQRKEKYSELHKAFPKKPRLWGGQDMCLPSLPPPGALALLVEAQMRIHPIPHVKELSGRGTMAACVCVYLSLSLSLYIYLYIFLCVYVYIYNRLY